MSADLSSLPALPAAPTASDEATRRTMQRNRRSDTKPEQALRSTLHRAGLRFRKDHRLLIEGVWVRPDIVFPRARVAVFVDGCFWHGCPAHGRMPTRNREYWELKIRRNQARDRRADAALAGAGWRVVRLWEHVAVTLAVERVAAAVAAADHAATSA